MTRDERLRQLERAARRAAEKAARRHPGTPVTRDELLQLRIPTAEPWKRLVVGVVGLALLVPGIWMLAQWLSAPAIVTGAVLAILGGSLSIAAIRGRQRTVQACIDELGSAGGEALMHLIASLFD